MMGSGPAVGLHRLQVLVLGALVLEVLDGLEVFSLFIDDVHVIVFLLEGLSTLAFECLILLGQTAERRGGETNTNERGGGLQGS